MLPSDFKRVAFSPAEFAALFGKSQTWGYRQIYSGKIKAITDHGRTLIAAAEVDRILQSSGIYSGREVKIPRTKAQIKKLAPKLPSAWKSFLQKRRDQAQPASVKSPATVTQSSSFPWKAQTDQTGRSAALARLTKKVPAKKQT